MWSACSNGIYQQGPGCNHESASHGGRKSIHMYVNARAAKHSGFSAAANEHRLRRQLHRQLQLIVL